MAEPAPDSTEVRAGPTDLGGGSWLAAGRRAVGRFRDNFLQDHAAALTYYGIQSIFPALLVLVTLLGLIGKLVTQPLINSLAEALPSSVHTIFLGAVDHLQRSHAAAGILALAGVALALWSASGYVAAFMRASNAIYAVPEGRPVWKTVPVRMAVTIVTVVLLVASAVMVVVTGGLASRIGSVIGAGPVALTVWNIAKWPVVVVLVSVMLAILYWASPNARRGLRWVSPGGVVAVILWLIASGLFALYIANFGHYNKVYGSLGGIIIFLIWLWLSNLAILMGAVFNAELERSRAIAGGVPPGTEPFAELRDTRRLRKARSRRGIRQPGRTTDR